jgi:hypothetical protein
LIYFKLILVQGEKLGYSFNFEDHPASSGDRNKARAVLGCSSLTQDVTFSKKKAEIKHGIIQGAPL